MNTSRYQECIDACDACARACDECASACLSEDDVGMFAACIRLDLDCAATCRVAAGLMARESTFVTEFCALCAGVCAACAAECSNHEAGHCQRCAEACNRCAQACRDMAAGPAAG